MADLESPFSILTAVAAPALLTNASTVLVLGLGNRIARVVDRTRAVATVLASVDKESELHKLLMHQATLLKQRTFKLSRAIRLGYAAVGGFAAEALAAVIGGTMVHYDFHLLAHATALFALCIGVASVGSLVSACVYMVHETTIALDNLAEEARTVMLEASRRKPSGS